MSLAVSRTRQELGADYIDLDRLYSAFVIDYAAEQLTWRPGAGLWSVAECIDHVARVNGFYLPVIEAAIADSRAPFAPPDAPLRTAGWPSAFFLRSVSPQGRNKLKAPPKVRPVVDQAAINPEDALRRLLATHEKIRGLVASASQPDLNRLRFKNPFIPLLRFTVSTGLLIMAGHGHRHHLQAQRVCESPGFPQAGEAARQKAL